MRKLAPLAVLVLLRLSASLAGGPIVYATRSGRTSDAPRPLGGGGNGYMGNGYTVRFSLGWVF